MSTPSKHYPYPAPTAYTYPARINPTYIQPSAVLTTGMFGMVVGGTAAMAVNLHRMQDNTMSMGQALTDSLVKGAGAGVATATATAAARAMGGSGLTNLVVLLATATGVGYVLNSVGKSAIAKSSTSTISAKKEAGE